MQCNFPHQNANQMASTEAKHGKGWVSLLMPRHEPLSNPDDEATSLFISSLDMLTRGKPMV